MGGWWLRMALWARNPPSTRRVLLVLGVIAVCAALWAIEAIWGWPAALTPERVPPGRM
ncbi:MAG: hypothetical protein AAGJ74_04000 [Pseudomonadota bacterium]